MFTFLLAFSFVYNVTCYFAWMAAATVGSEGHAFFWYFSGVVYCLSVRWLYQRMGPTIVKRKENVVYWVLSTWIQVKWEEKTTRLPPSPPFPCAKKGGKVSLNVFCFVFHGILSLCNSSNAFPPALLGDFFYSGFWFSIFFCIFSHVVSLLKKTDHPAWCVFIVKIVFSSHDFILLSAQKKADFSEKKFFFVRLPFESSLWAQPFFFFNTVC